MESDHEQQQPQEKNITVSPSGKAGEDDLSLPRATVYKIIQEMLPPDISIARETRDILVDCCNEFVHLIAGEANEVCERSGRKTISPEHIIESLGNLGFGAYEGQVREALGEWAEQAKEKEGRRGSQKLEATGLTEEELHRQQEALFAQARLKLQQQTPQ